MCAKPGGGRNSCAFDIDVVGVDVDQYEFDCLGKGVIVSKTFVGFHKLLADDVYTF